MDAPTTPIHTRRRHYQLKTPVASPMMTPQPSQNSPRFRNLVKSAYPSVTSTKPSSITNSFTNLSSPKIKLRTPSKRTPSKPKPKTYDRFIPNRQTMDLATSQFNMHSNIDRTVMTPDQIARQKILAEACGFNTTLNGRILSVKLY